MRFFWKPAVSLFLALLFLSLYFKFVSNGSFLSFSDGAKFAIIAKNLVNGAGYGSNFTFYTPGLFTANLTLPFNASGVPVLVPYAISLFFRLFGTTDLSVILYSGTFFVLTAVSVFLLARKLFGDLVGFLSALAFSANIDFLNYATSGASETQYTFFAVIAAYFIFVRNKWTDILFFVSLISLYLTKPQGVVFILALLLAWFLTKFSWKKGITIFSILVIVIFFLDKLVLYPMSFKYPVYPIVTRGIQALFQYSPAVAVSDALRGQAAGVVGFGEVLKKAFYNLYNFYKLLPDIASPYMWGLFAISLFVWGKDKSKNIFNLLTLLVVSGSFVLAALTIPFYRYLHPVVPFVYIGAVATLVEVMRLLNTDYGLWKRIKLYNLLSIILILFFVVGQTLGVIFLDSRFVRKTHNVGKPPVYVNLSRILKDNTDKSLVVITNLDTWGSWYGERKTVWFPLEPKQIINPNTNQIPFDAIYLTSYKMDDQNYYMGENWRQIFENPGKPALWTCDGCGEIAKEFKLVNTFNLEPSDNYEGNNAKAVLLVRK